MTTRIYKVKVIGNVYRPDPQGRSRYVADIKLIEGRWALLKFRFAIWLDNINLEGGYMTTEYKREFK